MGGQSAHRQLLLPYSPQPPRMHCTTLLPSYYPHIHPALYNPLPHRQLILAPDSIALNMHSGRPKLAHHPTNIPLQRQHLNTLHGHLALASCIIYHPIPDGSLTAPGISWFILIMSIIRPANAPSSHTTKS